jgi:hypothetical protein
MNFDWILAPVIQEIVLGAGLLGSLALWMSAKAETRALWSELAALRASTDEAIGELAAQSEKLREAPVCEPASSAPGLMAVQGLNLTARTKVLRMHRRGEAPSSIAAALGVQQEEVNLVLKLDRMLETPTMFR